MLSGIVSISTMWNSAYKVACSKLISLGMIQSLLVQRSSRPHPVSSSMQTGVTCLKANILRRNDLLPPGANVP
jgi:hypothetical protein